MPLAREQGKHWPITGGCICGFAGWGEELFKHIQDNYPGFGEYIEFRFRDRQGRLFNRGVPGHRMTQTRHPLSGQLMLECQCGRRWPIDKQDHPRGRVASQHREDVVRSRCGLSDR